MKPKIREQIVAPPQQQRGAALLILLTLVLLAASYTLLKKLNANPSDLIRAGDTAAVLGEAKAALIGYALRSQTRPGELPCPDYSNNGGDGDSALTCTGANNVTFRLPWKTLGLPDLRDSSGERLWYAVDPLFSGAGGINSDTPATQSIDGGATRYVAVIIAPGKSMKNQSRSGGQQDNILRYLEADNANNDTAFVTASAGDFNDQVLGITRDELMQAVERRVLKEVSGSLNTYFSENFYFPNPAPVGTSICDSSVNVGMVPTTITNAKCSPQTKWGVTLTAAALPTWFQPNNWNQTIWYVVSDDCDESATNACDNSSTKLLTVKDPPNSNDKVRALLIAGGIALNPAQNIRPPPTSDDHLLDLTENNNDDLIFQVFPIDATSNDQIQVVAQ